MIQLPYIWIGCCYNTVTLTTLVSELIWCCIERSCNGDILVKGSTRVWDHNEVFSIVAGGSIPFPYLFERPSRGTKY